MARQSSDILGLIGCLHEGVVDDDAWVRGLDSACRIIGSPFLILGTIDRDGLHAPVGHRLPAEFLDRLADAGSRRADNPWVDAAARLPLRRPLTVDDVCGQEALKRSRMWAELYRPFGVGETLGAILERQPGHAEIVKIGRPFRQPPFRPAELKAFGNVLPHLARAWRVKLALGKWRELAGTLTFILDRLERAVVVTGPEGHVRFANRAADQLLSRGAGIDVTRGRLRAERSCHSDALAALIDRAARTGIGAGSAAVDAVSIPRPNDNSALAVVAEPLAPAHSECLGHSTAPGAVLFISDSEASNRPSVERLGIVYGLTPAEARLTSLVVRGNGLASAADELGISPNTAKYHLKTVFGKVGVTRQTQLVRRVLADVGGLAEPEKLVPSTSIGEAPG